MVFANYALLCAAAILLNGAAQVTAEPRLGRFDRRIALSNLSASKMMSSNNGGQDGATLELPLVANVTSSSASVSLEGVGVLPPTAAGSITAIPIITGVVVTATSAQPPVVISPEPVDVSTSVLPTSVQAISTDEGSGDACAVSTNPQTVTIWSTIYTSTITWTGNPADYTPPYPTAAMPAMCTPVITSISDQVTVTVPLTALAPATPAAAPTVATPLIALTASGAVMLPVPTITAPIPMSASLATKALFTITFWTTDKNPAVIYSSTDGPNYGGSKTTQEANHNSPDSNKVTDSGDAAPSTSSQQHAAPTTPPPSTAVTVIVRSTQVIINGNTFTDNPQSRTTTVTVGTDTFTIDPSEVVGAGATVTRDAVDSSLTTTSIGSMQVIYGPTEATIGGTVFKIGPAPTTVVVQGQTITLGPAGIGFATETLPIATKSGATNAVVLGGELLTAVGNSIAIIDGTTFTYGPGVSATTEVVGDDSIIIGPSGIVIHSLTIGGATAVASATTYEIIGGATLSEVGGTAVVISNNTYHIGPSASTPITTVIAGETLTIGPSGVAASSYTFAEPYATSTVIEPGQTAAAAAATAASENAAQNKLPRWDTSLLCFCIALGVGYLI